MRNLLLLISILGVTTAGCGREATTAPPPQSPTWTLLEFHARGDGTGDSAEVGVAVLSSGEVTLHVRGEVVSSRGLLAGEKLETLVCFVDALPPTSYASPTPCTPDGFVVSLARDGKELSFASGLCDPTAPQSVLDVAGFFRDLIQDVLAVSTRPLPSTTLLVGTQSAIGSPRREVIRDRDALARLLREHSPAQPVAVPRVDFSRQMVVAEFLGARPTSGYSVESAGAELTQSRMTRIRFDVREPGPGCITAAVLTTPFVLVAMEARPDGELMFETSTLEVICE
jgi:hypothetical protein